jgi:GNAT superfamily N-acetyltransferase
MTARNELPEALAQRFARIDYRGHLALLAEVFADGRETMIGEARYVVDERDPAACEFAIAVADDWQTRGIARALLDRLERQAAASGIRRMVGDTLLANKAMIGLAARAGYAVRASREDATLARLEKRLTASAVPLPAQPLVA